MSEPSSNSNKTDFMRMVDAICSGDVQTAAKLLDSGFNVNQAEDPYWPSLHNAIEHQRVEIVRMLISAGADINFDVGKGWTPLAHAIDIESDDASQSGLPPEDVSTELVEILLAAGAKPNDRAFELVGIYRNHKARALLEGDPATL